MHDAVVAGHLCLDIFPDLSDWEQDRFEASFQPGRLVAIGPADFSTGGPVSNTGLALTKLGIRARLLGKVGDDLFGRAIQDHLRTYGADLADDMVVDRAAHSSYTIVITAPSVDRIFLYYPGANDTFGANDIRHDILRDARLFHFGYPPLMKRMYADGGIELTQIFRCAKEAGATTSLDMALPDPSSPAGRADWGAILRSVLPYVDVFLPSIEEILSMLRPETYQVLREEAGGTHILPHIGAGLLSDLGRELIAMGATIVALKLGERGLYLKTAGQPSLAAMGRARPSGPAAWANRELWAPCFQADIVGTTGAGDAAIAGLLSALLRDLPPEQAVTAAVAVGACNVESADALSGIRTWDDTWERVHSGWTRHELVPDAPGWEIDDQYQLWVRRRER
ncbi:carbohydrate kinase family protein [Chloroflexota bacterium]